MARPGRPSDPDAKRRRRTTRAQRLADVDGPTPELLAQRRRVAGDERVAIDFPLDVLAARHAKDPAAGLRPAAVQAGWRFARLAWRLSRAPVALPPLFWAARLERAGPTSPPADIVAQEEAERRALHRYRAARAALGLAGPAAVRAVDAAVVALELPGCPARLSDLRLGLAALAAHFERPAN
ncbi:hypothetical protein EDC65_1988 [Stella humosa]|uniref:Uncharacterized protein n=1 Tax=Stella humosa TaxID=94 RepID=A0A3N1M377_9PROT|nr:hypothetical protein [Stella humosa]ROQ00192.1 hypothetical protein EDC65_1988 [Stella humosa]BBK30573.1 hypothetical protein STHU_12070 [Stella humosa]